MNNFQYFPKPSNNFRLMFSCYIFSVSSREHYGEHQQDADDIKEQVQSFSQNTPFHVVTLISSAYPKLKIKKKKHSNERDICQKQPSRDFLRKRCFENMQQIYRRAPMGKCNFNKFATSMCQRICQIESPIVKKENTVKPIITYVKISYF